MSHAINLVCTRCTNEHHADLQRWYNDHAQLLMASDQLQSAELFRLNETASSIDYFCLYHFAQLEDFNAFDTGEVMAKVRNLSNAAPGRSSIEIVKRTQYERLLHRRWGTAQGGVVQAGMYMLAGSSAKDAVRWLNDALYALHLKHPLQSAQMYATALTDPAEIFVLLQSEAPEPLPLDWHALETEYAPRPAVEPIWQAQAEHIAQWMR